MWSFGCIAYELFTGKKAFANDHEAWQYGVANRSPKMYFKGLDDLQKHYIYGLLEVDPAKRSSAKALLKEKFLTETPSAKSPEDARAHKRRRIDQSSPKPSSLLKSSLKWAVSNKQLDLIILLAEAGVEPVSSREVCHVLQAFQANESSSFHIKLWSLVESFSSSFWRRHLPGVVSNAQDTANTTSENAAFFNHEESRRADIESEKSWSVSPISALYGDDWHAIWIKDSFDLSHIHSEHLQMTFSRDQVSFTADGRYFAAIDDAGVVQVYSVTVFSEEPKLSLYMEVFGGYRFRFTHDCSRLVVMSWDRNIAVWDLATKRNQLQIESLPSRSLSGIDVTRDDTQLVGVGGPHITRWSLDTGEFIDDYPVSDMELESVSNLFLELVAISSDGRFALAAGVNDVTYVWCFEGRSLGSILKGHGNFPLSLACSYANPHKAISGSYDDTVKLWTLPSTESLRGDVKGLAPSDELAIECDATFIGHRGGVCSVAFSPDERWIVSGSSDGSVRFWDSTDETLVLLLYGGEGKGG